MAPAIISFAVVLGVQAVVTGVSNEVLVSCEVFLDQVSECFHGPRGVEPKVV